MVSDLWVTTFSLLVARPLVANEEGRDLPLNFCWGRESGRVVGGCNWIRSLLANTSLKKTNQVDQFGCFGHSNLVQVAVSLEL